MVFFAVGVSSEIHLKLYCGMSGIGYLVVRGHTSIGPLKIALLFGPLFDLGISSSVGLSSSFVEFSSTITYLVWISVT